MPSRISLYCTLYLLILQLDVVLLHVAVDLRALVTQLLLQAFYQLPWTQIYNYNRIKNYTIVCINMSTKFCEIFTILYSVKAPK